MGIKQFYIVDEDSSVEYDFYINEEDLQKIINFIKDLEVEV